MKKKEVVIKITLDGENLQQLTEDDIIDIIDSIKVIVSLAKTLSILWEGDSTNGNA